MIGDVLKKIGGHTLVYAAGSIASRAIGFLMIPFYTHFLVPADYGLPELLDLTTFIIGSVVGLGLNAAILRYYHEQPTEELRREVISTALLFGVALLAAVYAVLFVTSPGISSTAFNTDAYASYLRLVFVSLCLDTVGELALTYVRSKQESVRATLFPLARLVISLSLNVYFIAGLGLGVLGVLYSGLIASGTVATTLIVLTLREVGLRFSREKLTAMLRYGIPLIPMTLGLFVLNFSDRFFLQRYASLTAVGVYSLGYKFGMVSGVLITSPFLQFWAAYMYEVVERPNGRELIAQLQVYFTLLLLAFTLGLSLLSEELLRVLSPPEYWGAARVIPIVGLSYVFMGLSHFFRVGLYYTKQTKYLGYAVGGTALLNLPLNLLLIPPFGAMGAAWATLLSFATLAVVTLLTSQRRFPITYEYGRLVRLLAAGAAVFLTSLLFHVEALAPAIALDLLLLASFPVLLFVLGFFKEAELRKGKQLARALTRRLGLTGGLP